MTAPRQEVEQIVLCCLRDTFDGEIKTQIYQINPGNTNNTRECSKDVFQISIVEIIRRLIESNLTAVNASNTGLMLVMQKDISSMPFCMVYICTAGGVLASQYKQHIYTPSISNLEIHVTLLIHTKQGDMKMC